MKKCISDRPAPHYDRVTEAWGYILGENLHYGFFNTADDDLDAATTRLTEFMAHLAQLDSTQKVLDVGCGTGEPALYLARQLGCQITAISISEVGLEKGRRLSRDHGFSDHIEFLNRDGLSNGFPDEFFDCIWIMESSHLIPQIDGLIAESVRVLKPGGTIVLCDIVFHRELSIHEILQEAKAFDLLRQVYGQAYLKTMAYYEKCLLNEGLEITHAEDISAQTRLTFEHWRQNAVQFRPNIERLVGPDYWQQFVESCDVLESFWQQQILGYAVFAARKSLFHQAIETAKSA